VIIQGEVAPEPLHGGDVAGARVGDALPTCSDALRNGDETDVDCGGPTCGPCAVGRACATAGDCLERVCDALVCSAPTCTDAVRNGDEADLDCGGAACAPCLDGRACVGDADCASALCVETVCVAATCVDGRRNGSETDVDCGGPTCADCAAGRVCGTGADCLSLVCAAGVCASPTCTDTLRNGSETDIDCGGPACADCAIGRVCGTGVDCVSGVCTAGVCRPAPTFAADVAPIFAARCGSCHTTGGSGGANFATSYAESQRVSYYCAGLTKGACTVVRVRNLSMPAMTPSELAVVDAWIAGGQRP
jgi:hypothetical protein